VQDRSVVCTASRPALGPTEPPVHLLPGVKRPGHEADRLPRSVAEVKYAWCYISTPPYVFVVWSLFTQAQGQRLPLPVLLHAAGDFEAKATIFMEFDTAEVTFHPLVMVPRTFHVLVLVPTECRAPQIGMIIELFKFNFLRRSSVCVIYIRLVGKYKLCRTYALMCCRSVIKYQFGDDAN
jgi:hypothetical protein